jgi:hypothetical protein
MTRRRIDWVVVGGAEGEVAHCTRCGEGLRLGLPIAVEILLAAGKAFEKIHGRCQARPEGSQPPKPTTLAEWLAGRDTGISSRTICGVIAGVGMPEDPGVPRDPSDFGRCYRLLALFPSWRAELARVAGRFPAWTPIVREWDRLTALYLEELGGVSAPKLYAAMRELVEEGMVLDGWKKDGPGSWSRGHESSLSLGGLTLTTRIGGRGP